MSDVIGYRFSCDEKHEAYIITISAPNEQEGLVYLRRFGGSDFYSENCRCISIKKANTGEEVTEANLYGVRGNWVLYRKGEIIPGKTWYLHSVEELYRHNLLQIDVNGYTVGNVRQKTAHNWIWKIDNLITEVCQASHEELAEELHISIVDLEEKIEYCKKNGDSVKAYEIAGCIADAGNSIYKRKLKNGEIEPGYKKYLRSFGIEI